MRISSSGGSAIKTSVRTRLWKLVLAAAIVPVIFYGLLNAATFLRMTAESTRERLKRVGSRVSEEITSYIKHNFDIMETLVESFSGAMMTPEQVDVLLKNYVVNFSRIRDMQIRVGRHWYYAILQKPMVTPPLFSISAEKAVSSIAFEKETGLPVIFLQLKKKDSILGDVEVTARVSIIDLWKRLMNAEADTGITFILTDGQARIIAHSRKTRKAQALVFNDTRVRDFLAHSSDNLFVREPDETYSMVVTQEVKGPGWFLAAAQPVGMWGSKAFYTALRIFAFILSFVSFATLVSYYQGGYITGAVEELVKGTRETAAENFSYRIRLRTGDELEELADAFNEMNTRIRELLEEVKEKERKLTFVRLIRGVLHDLKHPFAGMKTALSFRDAEKMKEQISRHIEETEQLFEDLQALGQEKLEIPLLKTPVHEVVKEAVDMYSDAAKRKGIAISFQTPEKIYAHAHPQYLLRVLCNLVENAVQATSHGKIEVIAKDEGEKIKIVVVDTGKGIPPENLPRIFQWEFSTKHRGLGLGLALCKRFVEAMDGSITVESEVGRGTTFTIVLKKHREEKNA